MKKAVSILLSLFLVFSVMILPAQAATSLKMPKSITSKKYGKMYDISVKGSTMNIKYCGPYTSSKQLEYPPTNQFETFMYPFIDYNKTEWNPFYKYADAPAILAVSPLRIQNHIETVNITYPQDYINNDRYNVATFTFSEPQIDKNGNTNYIIFGSIKTKQSPGYSYDKNDLTSHFSNKPTEYRAMITIDQQGHITEWMHANKYPDSSTDYLGYEISYENNNPVVTRCHGDSPDSLESENLPDISVTTDSNGRWTSFTHGVDDYNNNEVTLKFDLNNNGQITKLNSSWPYDNTFNETLIVNY